MWKVRIVWCQRSKNKTIVNVSERKSKMATGSHNNKIVLYVEEYPSSINNEVVDGKCDSPSIKKKEEIYNIPSNNTSHVVPNGNDVDEECFNEGLEI